MSAVGIIRETRDIRQDSARFRCHCRNVISDERIGRAIKKIRGIDCITVDPAVTDTANVAAKWIVSGADRPNDMKILLHDAFRFMEKPCQTIPSREPIPPTLDRA